MGDQCYPLPSNFHTEIVRSVYSVLIMAELARGTG